MNAPRPRPGPLLWIWYAFGGKLPSRYREWVLYDVTSRTRWLRQAARGIVQLTPLAVVIFLVLGWNWITWTSVLCGILLGLIYNTAYLDLSAEHRLRKHGYPPGTLERVLSQRRDAEGDGAIARDNRKFRRGER
jgi:hypothetical protein